MFHYCGTGGKAPDMLRDEVLDGISEDVLMEGRTIELIRHTVLVARIMRE